MAKSKSKTLKQKSIDIATNRYWRDHKNAIMFAYADKIDDITPRKAKRLFKEEIKENLGTRSANAVARDILREENIKIKVRSHSKRENAIRKAIREAYKEEGTIERIVKSYRELNPNTSEEQAKQNFEDTIRRNMYGNNRSPAESIKHTLRTNTFMSKEERQREYEEEILTGKQKSLKGSYRDIKKALGIKYNETLEKKRKYLRVEWDPYQSRYAIVYEPEDEKGNILFSKKVWIYRPDQYRNKRLKWSKA